MATTRSKVPTLADAIAHLRPGANFADVDGTLGRIRWDDPRVKPPTQAEVDAAMAALEAPPTTEQKLKDAGFSVEELKQLFGLI